MLHFDNLTLGYDRHPVVHHLHGHIAPGSLLAVIGPNGGGKSTLLKGILGQLPPLQGAIRLAVDRHSIGYLPQQSRIDRQFPISVREMVAMGLWRHCGLFGRLAHRERHKVEDALARVGLSGMAEKRLDALSGGQLQRALFARLWLPVAKETSALEVPASAVLRRSELTAVYVLDANDRPRLRQVRLGQGSQGADAQARLPVLTGLRAGERVVLDPQAAAKVR